MNNLINFFKQFSLMAVTHSVAMKMGLAVDTVTVKAMASIRMPKELEGEISGGSSICLVLDRSSSTNNPINSESRDNKICKAIMDCAIEIVKSMGENDQVSVVAFNDGNQLIAPLTSCSQAGKEEVIAAIESSYYPDGGTNYSAGLQAAVQMLEPSEGKRVIIFVSDGQHLPNYPDPTMGSPSLSEQILSSGTAVYTCAVTDNLSASDELRLKVMSGGQNFMAATTAGELVSYFQTALKKSGRAAVTNAQLIFKPIGLVQAINHIELVNRNENRSYVRGVVTPRTDDAFSIGTVALGEIAPGDQIDCFIEFVTKLPKFREDVTEQTNTFGQLILEGMVPALGVVEMTSFVTEEMRQRFAVDTPGTTNPKVDKIYGLAEAARALDDLSKADNNADQEEILRNATVKVRRATQVVMDDDDTAAVEAALQDLENLQAATGSAAEKAKAAGRKTVIFVDDEEEVPVAAM